MMKQRSKESKISRAGRSHGALLEKKSATAPRPAQPNLYAVRLLCVALLISPLFCACTVVTYTAPQGDRFWRGALGGNTAISTLVVEAGSNGVRRVELRGYRNESTQALGVVTEAAVRAALQPR